MEPDRGGGRRSSGVGWGHFSPEVAFALAAEEAGMIDAVECVVIGSGALGSSAAFHLAKAGKQVALLDKHALGSQTSPRAAGLTSQARAPI